MVWEGVNRRKAPRVVFPCLVKIMHREDAEEVLLTHTFNVSIGGVCVIIKRCLEATTNVGVEVDLMDGEDLISCVGKVAWTILRKPTEDHKPSFYDTGIEFLDLKEVDRIRLEKLIDRLVSDRHRIRRRK